MDWTMAPFTVYLGVKGKVDKLAHHNYFLGNNFKGYANKIFTSSISPQKPYYYVNVLSKSEPQSAFADSENIFILCPVPDLRFKPDWFDVIFEDKPQKNFLLWFFIIYILTFSLEVAGVKTGLIFGDYFYGNNLGFK